MIQSASTVKYIWIFPPAVKSWLFLFLFCCWMGSVSIAADRLPARGERPPVDFSKLDASAYEPGIIHVRFAAEAEPVLRDSGPSKDMHGFVKTGIPGFDMLSQKYGFTEVVAFLDLLYAASPVSLEYADRHREWGFHLWYEFVVPAKTDVFTLVRELNDLGSVEVAEPVYRIRQILPVDTTRLDMGRSGVGAALQEGSKLSTWAPNDPFFPSHQWHLNNTGQTVGGQSGTPGVDISAPVAWTISKGSPSVIVAVIDDGVHFTHPDLAGNMWPGIGYNFVDGSSTIDPGGSHGTHVAGTISAVTNNGTGVAGIAGGSGSGNGVQIMSCQIFTAEGSGNAHLAMIYAADNGAAISQNSWGYENPGVYNQSILDAIDYFNQNGGGTGLSGGISVFAAGNANSDDRWYPAYYPGAIAVAATDNRDVKASYSNYGSWIDISSPGNWIASTSGATGYGAMSGTSAACPIVSGVAALLASYSPGSSASQVALVVLQNTDNHYPKNPAYTGKLGSGRLNAAKALSQFSGTPVVMSVSNPLSFGGTAVSTSQIDLAWQKNANNNQVMVAVSSTGVFGTPANGSNHQVGTSISGGGTVLYRGSAHSYSHTGLNEGTTYYYKAWSYDANNTYSTGVTANATTSSEQSTYTITAYSGSNGNIEPSGTITVEKGGSQSFTIMPDQDFTISRVLINGADVGSVSSYTFSNVQANQTISAEFTRETFVIQASAGPNGSISPTGDIALPAGSDQTFNMTPDPGYYIADVMVNGISVGNPSSYTFEDVRSNQQITVTFGNITYTIVATAGEHGSIDPLGEITLNKGTNQEFTIKADTGYHIEDVLVDGESLGAVSSYIFSDISADHTIEARFQETLHTITVTVGPGGNIDPSGEVVVSHFGGETFQIVPDPGYRIQNVVINGVNIGPTTSYEFFNVRSNQSIAAYFVPIIYTITATSGEGGTITPAGELAITVEDVMEFEIKPEEGFLVADVFLDGESIGSVEFFAFSEVTSDRIIHAEFEEIIPEATYPVTFQVDMQFVEIYNPEMDIVYITGSMFGWAEPGSLPEARMVPDDKSPHILRISVELPEGAYEYKYFLNEGSDGEEWPGEPLRTLQIPEIDLTHDFFGHMTDPTHTHFPDDQDGVKIFPNPASDRLSVESSGPIRSIQLIDIVGRELYSAEPGQQSHTLHTAGLPEGIYFIRVVLMNRVYTSQVILRR